MSVVLRMAWSKEWDEKMKNVLANIRFTDVSPAGMNCLFYCFQKILTQDEAQLSEEDGYFKEKLEKMKNAMHESNVMNMRELLVDEATNISNIDQVFDPDARTVKNWEHNPEKWKKKMSKINVMADGRVIKIFSILFKYKIILVKVSDEQPTCLIAYGKKHYTRRAVLNLKWKHYKFLETEELNRNFDTLINLYRERDESSNPLKSTTVSSDIWIADDEGLLDNGSTFVVLKKNLCEAYR